MKGIHPIPIPQGETIELLRSSRERCEDNSPEASVFPLRDRQTVPYHFRRGLERADIGTEGCRIDVYSLRHTYNTRLKDLLDEAYVGRFMGHRNAVTN